MNISRSIFLLITLTAIGSGQSPVYSEPAFPTEWDSIVVYFDATLGNQGLMGYTGDVYTHTGVNTNNGDWQHVIGSWGNNSTQPKLTRIATDLYQLVIGKPRSFYNITSSSEHISELAFVFRAADGSSQTSPDIFHTIYDTDLNAVFVSPQVNVTFGDPLRSPLFVDADDTVEVVATAVTQSYPVDSLTLTMNNLVVSAGKTDTLNYRFIAADHGSGPFEFTIKAQDSIGVVDSSTIVLFVNPIPQVLVPPAGIEPGINYIDYNTVILALFAPYKDNVYVIGDFNDWKVDTTYSMHRHSDQADSTLWWVTIDNLSPGTEYAFQYLIDGDLRIADPYTAKVLDPWNDGYIGDSVYPNLKEYPAGKTDGITAVLQPAQSSYNWQYSDSFVAPPQEELIIFEMLVRDFIHTHSYTTLIDTLDYLENLGINAIELMPINEFEGNESWGYNPSFYFAADKYYGRESVLKEFIDECHRRGIAVIIDMVLNHSYGQSPLVQMYFDYYATDEIICLPENPWYNIKSPNRSYYWGADFDHESDHTRYFMDRVNRYWLTEYKVDGFRFDFTKGFTNKSGDGWSYDGSRVNILKRMADQIWNVNSEAYVILEHLADNSEEKVLSDYGIMLWGNTNYNYSEAAMGWHDSYGKSDFSWGYYTDRGWNDPHLVTYMESHDEERLMFKNLAYGNSSGSYDIQELSTALDRMKLVNGFFLTLPGPKMIWQFGEVGYDYSIDHECRVCNKPIKWSYYADPDRRRLYKTIQALLNLRAGNEVFRSAETVADVSYLSSGLKRIRLSHASMKVVIVGNFGVTSASINPNFYTSGDWYEFFSGDTLFVGNPTDNIDLGPGELRIYTDAYVEPAEEGLLDILPEQEMIPTELYLAQNYPNPFNPTTRIDYSLPEAGDVVLTIYDITGREVNQLVRGFHTNGWHSVTWDGRNSSGNQVAAGMYLYSIRTDRQVQTKKLVLLK